MIKEYEEYWDLMKISLGFEQCMDEYDWDKIYKICIKHNTLPLIYYGLWKNGRLEKLPEKVNKEWHDIMVKNCIVEASKTTDLERVLKAAVEKGIKLVCFKGNVLAQTYPEWKTRLSKDSDIFVYERDRDNIHNLLIELGYDLCEEHSKNMVPVYIHPVRAHVIELHFSLWEDYEGIQINKLDSLGIVNEEELIEINIGSTKVFTLEPTNHLIFQMFHIIKHFIVQGIGMKYMLDIMFFVNYHIEQLDMKKFWESMELLHYKDFCCYFFALCIKYLGMNESVLSDKEVLNEKDKLEKLLSDLMDFSEKDNSNYNVITLMSPYLEGRDSVSGNNFSRKLNLIFPKPDALQDDFLYAKKNHILLPIAWVHKWFRFIFNRLSGKSNSLTSKLGEADKRIQMMQDMNLLD